MAKFVDITYNRDSRNWEVTLIDRETSEKLYSSRRAILLQAMADCLSYAKDPDSIDDTDWAKATLRDMQRILEGDGE